MDNKDNKLDRPKIFDNFSKNAQLFSPQIATLEQMGITMENIIRGRPVKPFPFKYNDFNSLDDLKEYIRYTITQSSILKWEWLAVSNYTNVPWGRDLDTYYQSAVIVAITCYEPVDESDKNPFNRISKLRGGHPLMELNPNKWSYAMVKEIVESLKVANKE